MAQLKAEQKKTTDFRIEYRNKTNRKHHHQVNDYHLDLPRTDHHHHHHDRDDPFPLGK